MGGITWLQLLGVIICVTGLWPMTHGSRVNGRANGSDGGGWLVFGLQIFVVGLILVIVKKIGN